MITDRHRHAFELIAIHHCTQGQAGAMMTPPVSQQTVSILIRELYSTNPGLEAVKEFLSISDPQTPPFPILQYDESMDSSVNTKF